MFNRVTFFAIIFLFSLYVLLFFLFTCHFHLLLSLCLICSSLYSFCHTLHVTRGSNMWCALANEILENIMQAKPRKKIVCMFSLFFFLRDHHEGMPACWKMRHMEQSSGLPVKTTQLSLHLTKHSWASPDMISKTTQETPKLMNNNE